MSTLHERLKQRTRNAEAAYQQEKQWVQNSINNAKSAAVASRLDNPINSPSVQSKISAKIAQNLDNSLINKATQGTTNPAEMYRPGNVTESWFKSPNYVSNSAMTEMVDRANARLALQQDNTAVEKAREAAKKSTEQQKAAMERMVADLYQKMEGYKSNGQTAELSKAEQQYKQLNESIAQMQSKLNGSAMEEAKEWETRRYNEIMATGGRTLMANLDRLVELADSMAKEAGQWGNNKKNDLAEKETEYYELYNNLKSKYGEQVDSWLDYAKRMGNKSRMAMSTAMARQAAEDKPFWSSVGAIPLNLASGIGYLDAAGQKLQRKATGSDTPIDYNTPAQAFSKMSNTVQGTVSEDMGGVGKFLYGTGMSMANSLAAMPMGGFGMALLGGSAATNAMQTAIERGASDDQALKIGLVAGAMEVALEKTSIDSLFNLTDSKTVADFFTNAFKQSGAELTEEGLTKLGNTFADAVIMGNKSELNTAKRDYIADGYSPEKAEGMALKDWGVDLLLDMAGGALSGFLFGSFKSGFDVVRNGGFEKPTAENTTHKLKPEAQEQQTVVDITPTPQQEAAKSNPNQKWEKFFSKNNGAPSSTVFQNFTSNLSETDSAAFIAYLDEQEKAGNLKWRGDGTPALVMAAEDHIDNRDYGSVGDPKVKSFQYNNPELQPFIQEGLQILADDLDHTLPGERYYNGIDPNGVGSQGLWSGQKRHTTPEIARLKDDYGMSYADINKAMDDLTQDAGKENNANAKRIELVIDQILTKGHRTLSGAEFPPNQAYIDAKGKIAGARPVQQQTDTEVEELPIIPGYGEVQDAKPAMGAADAGFSPYSAYQNTQSKFIPEGANAARPVDVPATDPTGKNTRRFLSNAMGAQGINEDVDARLQSDFMEGKYGYDIKGDPEAVRNAQNTLQNSPYDRFYGETLERLQSMKNLKQTVVDAQLLALEAQRKGNDADAAEILLLLAETGTEFGQAVQAYSIFRKLTPEGQLEGVRRAVQRINEKAVKKGGRPKYSEADQTAIMDAVDDVRETALRLLTNIHEAFSERDHGLEVENWIQEIGNQLATTMDKNKTPSTKKAQTVASTLRKDLQAFAKAYMDKHKPDARYNSARALENFLNNREQYADAWNEARWKLQEKYANNPEMLDALHDFMANDISLEQLEQGIDRDISKALSQIGAKTAEIIRSNTADKFSVANQVKDMLMKDHQLSDEDAQKMADFILDRFNHMVAERSQKTLEAMFKPRDKKAKQTVLQRFSELANLGAFTDNNYRKAASEKLFGTGIEVKKELADKFLAAPDEQARADVMEEIYQDIGSKLPTTLGEIANQWRYTAMLLNPSTHAKNIIGSATQFSMSMVKDALAVPGEALANKISGGKTGRTKAYLNLKSEADQNLLNIAGQYYDAHRDDIMGESQYSNTPEGKINQYKTVMKLNNPQTKVAKAVDSLLRGAGKAADWNTDVMDIEDAWFSRPRFQTALAGYMKANGLNEVTDEAYKYAKSEAQKATYRDMNAVSEWASKLGRKTDNPVGKIFRFVINADIPFKKSVANIGVRAVEYSPLGLIKTGTDIAKAAYRKDAGAVAGIINDLAANATGSLLYALGIAWAKDGLLRARGSEDDKEREQLKREGYKDNALYVGDVAIPIEFLGAVSIPLLLGASTYEAIARANNSEEGLTWQDYISIGARSLDPLAETTMLQGVRDATETFVGNNPQASLMEAITFGLMETVGNYYESFIPTALSRTAASLDKSARQSYVEPDSQFPELDKVMQGLQYKIPGARNQMVERVDAYGNTVSGGLPDTGNKLLDVLGAIGNAVTPTYPSKTKTTAVDEEMRRLYNVDGLNKGDRTVFISDAPKHFEVDGKEVYLTGDQYVEYQKTRNSSIQQIRNDVMSSDRYDDLPDDIKLRAMSDAANYANALAKAGLDVGYKIKTKWMNELAGVSPEEVADAIITRSIENAAEDYEGGKFAGLSDMLDSGSIDDKLAISLLPKEQYDRYEKYGKNVPASDLMDALAYKNSDESKGLKDKDGKDIKGETRQDHVKAWMDEKYGNDRHLKIGIWCTLYAESTCPW